MIRVRHYTRVSAMRKIMKELRIAASDKNSVFVERATSRRLSPADAVDTYGLQLGRGNAYVEFDIQPERLWLTWNARQKCEEGVIVGDIDLTDKNPLGFVNR